MESLDLSIFARGPSSEPHGSETTPPSLLPSLRFGMLRDPPKYLRYLGGEFFKAALLPT